MARKFKNRILLYRSEKGRENLKPQLKERLSTYKEIRAERPRKKIPRIVVPSFFTLMNLFCGFIAIIQVHEAAYLEAAWLIVVAALFDLLDGLMARLANATSLFGVELDSLSDMVSFGVAPAFLIYEFGLSELGILGIIIASLLPICGAVRLARFNIDFEGEKKLYFEGLPIPAQAITIVAFLLSFYQVNFMPYFEHGMRSVLLPLIIILAALMVSTIEFLSIPKPTLNAFRERPKMWMGYGICLLLILFLQEVGLFISILLYLVVGVGRAIILAIRAIWQETTPKLSEDS